MKLWLRIITLALKFLSRDVDVTPIVPALQNFFDDALNYTVRELNFKTLVDGLAAVFYQYPFNVPAYYALISRYLTVLEGLALNADPNFKVLDASYPLRKGFSTIRIQSSEMLLLSYFVKMGGLAGGRDLKTYLFKEVKIETFQLGVRYSQC
ncbi:Protein ACTIVITY OF BC1 COMPLEX KINASE 3, chloroplastic [Linum grandiflorum]